MHNATHTIVLSLYR